MRRRILLLSPALLLRPAIAQDTFSIEVIQDVDMPREKIFDNALLWLAETFVSSKKLIDLQDRGLGTIIGNVGDDIKIGWGVTLPISYKIRIDVRDNKYRMTFANVLVHTAFGIKPIEQTNRNTTESGTRERCNALAESFRTYLSNAAKSATW